MMTRNSRYYTDFLANTPEGIGILEYISGNGAGLQPHSYIRILGQQVCSLHTTASQITKIRRVGLYSILCQFKHGCVAVTLMPVSVFSSFFDYVLGSQVTSEIISLDLLNP